MERKCLACSGSDLIQNVAILDRGENHAHWRMTLATFENPDAWLFKGAHNAEATASVCRDCGYVMLYVSRSGIAELGQAP